MTSKERLLIAIDGPAASGKGTVAKRIAQHFDIEYLDTGRIYRAVGLAVLTQLGSTDDTAAIIDLARNFDKDRLLQTEKKDLYCEGVGGAASIVSAIPQVREALLEVLKDFANTPKGAVLDGRDIATVVCPHANYKFYITADIEARATRRYKQLQNKGIPIIYADVLAELKKRDDRDQKREIAPLLQADDAIHIDTTNMSADDVFEKMLSTITADGSA